MKLVELEALKYRSLREATVAFGGLNVFIGANASGKSTVLDALRLVHEGLLGRDFRDAVYSRGGISQLAWKGEGASRVRLSLRFEDGADKYEWSVELAKGARRDFSVREDVFRIQPFLPPDRLLFADNGAGAWWSGRQGQWVHFEQHPTACALAAASVDTGFQARGVASFVSAWGFCDPSPFALRRGGGDGAEPGRLEVYGGNLAERLYRLKESSLDTYESIVGAAKAVLGLSLGLEPGYADGGYYLAQREPGFDYPAHQAGVSAGTLRVVALLTALLERAGDRLVAIEEPENNLHPAALGDFAGFLTRASDRMQLVVTTHSPILLDFLEDPASVSVVRRDGVKGTRVVREGNPKGVREALAKSGFSLGEYHQTRGFGE